MKTPFSALILLIAAAAGAAADPVRVVAVSRNSNILLDAAKRFQQRHGAGLLSLEVFEKAPDEGAIGRADAVFIYYAGVPVYESMAAAVRDASRRGAVILPVPAENASRLWGVPIDAAAQAKVAEYWKYGGVENLTSFLGFVYRLAGGRKAIRVSPPAELPTSGIYHPAAQAAFHSLDEYLAWYRRHAPALARAPLVGILTYSTQYKFNDLAHIDALAGALERRGIGVVPIFGWPLKSLSPLMESGGGTPLRLLMAFSLGFTNDDDIEVLEKYGLHVINLMTSRGSEKEWLRSPQGIEPTRLAMTLGNPERAGATEPLLVGVTEAVPGTDAVRTVPVAERVEMAARRAERWLALQSKPNAEKRIAVIYYNNPPGKGNFGASYLSLFPSLRAILGQLERTGYRLGGVAPNERELVEMLQQSGRNVESWAPGELKALVDNGRVTLVSMEKYRRWFAQLPAGFRDAVIRHWGQPEQSRLMTIASPDGRRYFVIAGIRLGNIFLGPQPLRTAFAKSEEALMKSLHDTLTPPPHSYVAAYLWYRHEYRADAVVHVGRHGTLEWLPGKAVAQSGSDCSEVILGELPNINYYITDGGGEAIQAKRRSAAVLIGHLTPLVAAGGKQDDYRQLEETLTRLAQVEGVSTAVAENYRLQAKAEIRRLGLDKQLQIDLDAGQWEEVQKQVEWFLEALEAAPIPMGMHTLGALPGEDVQKEALAQLIRTGFQEDELPGAGPLADRWAEAIFAGRAAEVPRGWMPALRDKAQTVLAEASRWLAGLRESPRRELESLAAVLEGRYLSSGPLGDCLRTPSVLPSGRNLHDFDTAMMPTRAAWETGRRMAQQMLERYRARHGKWPENVSMVLWYGETSRHHGAMESQALYLMGVEPVWNSRGKVDGVKLIPDAQLGRPRVNVLFTLSGMYRDGLSDKVLLLTKAAQLAAAAGDNALSRHNRRVAAELRKAGVEEELAARVAQARAFSAAPGDYGAGISKMVDQSRNAGNEKGIAGLFLRQMNHAYSDQLWGQAVEGALEKHLQGNQAVIHSRSSNVYGVLDNDDFYEYAGGLNLASKTVNGAAPDFYVNNLRRRGKESVEDFRRYLALELNARVWNPKWIREMKKAGYAGARQIARHVDHLYGFQATAAEQMDASYWQKTFDVLVADQHGMELEKFFEAANPHAMQRMQARLLEVDRQGAHRFSEADRATLIRQYVASVNRHGVDCSANTCGNRQVHQYIVAQSRRVPGLGAADLRAFGRRLAGATQWPERAFRDAPREFREGLREAARARPRPVTVKSSPAPRPVVQGYRMAERTIRLPDKAVPPAPVFAWAAALVLFGLLAAGMLREALRARA